MSDNKESVPMWVKVCIGVLGFSVVVWTTAWAASKSDSATVNLVASHESRLTATEHELKQIDKRLDGMEKMYIKQEAAQKALLNGQNEMKAQMAEQNKLMIEKIKSDAELRAWLKSIDKVN